MGQKIAHKLEFSKSLKLVFDIRYDNVTQQDNGDAEDATGVNTCIS